MTMTRNNAARIGGIIILALLMPLSACWSAPRPLIGAIRWDAWIGPYDAKVVGYKDIGAAVERHLGPPQFHDRVPFYGKITGPNSVEARELTQDVMDKEIRYAHDAGLAYWAMCWYPDGSGLDIARHLYLSSKIKKLIKYCYVRGWIPPSEFPTLASMVFKDPCYLKVLGNRPLLYLFGSPNTPQNLEDLRKLTRAAGLGDPYVVQADLGQGCAHTVVSAFDGDTNSYWQAADNQYAGEWLEVEFGAKTTFDKAVLAEKGGRTSAYEIRYWDGSQWLTAYTGTTIGSGDTPTTVTFPAVTGTKARLCFLVGKQEPQVNEFQLFNTKGTADNLALSKKYAASSTGYHYDALSRYVIGAWDAAPYSKTMSNCLESWNGDKKYGPDVIPNVSAGDDARPRILDPVPWGFYRSNWWSQEPTPEELGANVKQALDWIDANPTFDPARLVIIYAWNEFDEGGWICPTLLHGSDRLDAIHKVLDAYKRK